MDKPKNEQRREPTPVPARFAGARKVQTSIPISTLDIGESFTGQFVEPRTYEMEDGPATALVFATDDGEAGLWRNLGLQDFTAKVSPGAWCHITRLQNKPGKGTRQQSVYEVLVSD